LWCEQLTFVAHFCVVGLLCETFYNCVLTFTLYFGFLLAPGSYIQQNTNNVVLTLISKFCHV